MMVLNIHVPGATPYEIGDEIWQESLADAIRAEAEIIAAYAGADLLKSPDQAHRDALRDRLTVDMTAALAQIADQYRSPDGVLYSLTAQPALDACAREASLTPMSCPAPSPTVEGVLRFEDLPPGSPGTRRAVVRGMKLGRQSVQGLRADQRHRDLRVGVLDLPSHRRPAIRHATARALRPNPQKTSQIGTIAMSPKS
jgi:hypothetical protein